MCDPDAETDRFAEGVTGVGKLSFPPDGGEMLFPLAELAPTAGVGGAGVGTGWLDRGLGAAFERDSSASEERVESGEAMS